MRKQARPRLPSITRYTLPDGTRVPKGTPGARKIKELGDTYVATIRIDGKRVTISLETTDEATAWQRLRERLRREADRAAGIRDDYTDHASRPIAEHVEAWLASVTSSGTTADQVKLLRMRVLHLADLARWVRLPDVTAASCLSALAELQRESYHQGQPQRKGARANRQGRSAQTRNHYLTAAKGFLRWCWEDKRTRDLPLVGLSKISVETDRRHDRRSPTDEEIRQLFDYLEAGQVAPPGVKWTIPADGSAAVRCGMSGPVRALAYRVAMTTGFRANEVRNLVLESFSLAHGCVTVRAAYSKRRRSDTQDLPPWLVEQLRTWFASGGDPAIWAGFPRKTPGRILQDDLAGAGVEYSVPGPDGPLFFDFHALRHWYCTWAANLPGISPKTLMTLTRHSSVELAMKIYAKVRRADVRAAVEAMPDPTGKPAADRPRRQA